MAQVQISSWRMYSYRLCTWPILYMCGAPRFMYKISTDRFIYKISTDRFIFKLSTDGLSIRYLPIVYLYLPIGLSISYLPIVYLYLPIGLSIGLIGLSIGPNLNTCGVCFCQVCCCILNWGLGSGTQCKCKHPWWRMC